MNITGNLLKSMALSGAALLSNKKEEINNLNVFPVPDGDTGINMSLTMSTIANTPDDLSVGESADKIAALMLRSARGNSGAILSLFFRGVAKALKGVNEAKSGDLVEAFKRGTTEAYRAVMKPTEGTILTVMRMSGEAAEAAYTANKRISVKKLFSVIENGAADALAQTPEMLPVLKQTGVVDAGGYGFVCVLQGMSAALEGRPYVAEQTDDASENRSSADFGEFNTEDIKFSYCTECIVDKNEKYLGEDTSGELYEFIKSIGDSAVFVDDESIIKLHIHTNDPGAVLTKAIEFGSLATVKIENMKNQHTELTGGESKAQKSEEQPAKVEEPKSQISAIEKKYGFVSVCMGDGVSNMFKDIGADNIITGGQTMNPSTQDILNAVMQTPAEIVFVLPNNKNICMVANQAAEIVTDRKVVVIPTHTVPQGMSAMIAFNPDGELDDVIKEMNSAIEMVTSMSVTFAVRDTKIDRFSIKKGQFLGLVEGKIACVTNDNFSCMKQLARGMTGASYVTVFYGEGVSEEQANKVAEMITERVEGCEVAMLPGGQPLYDFIISVEQ
ncbi:MAG: DAK2 domain-containing protein [Ruminococcaceae bacterium]|nr:DAK2 domain-containing protein [Oscillospiraceae bacterium]